MSTDLSPVVAATTQWLLRAYPSASGAMNEVLAERQARQAVTVAAWLRYPTAIDAALLSMAGPGGAGRLDGIVEDAPLSGADRPVGGPVTEVTEVAATCCGGNRTHRPDQAWRSWVDEVVASWAACLLANSTLAVAAASAVADSEHAAGCSPAFHRLTDPDRYDRRAAPLLRHPDLLTPISELHRPELVRRLGTDT